MPTAVYPAWQIYADELAQLGYGHALWEPAALHNYDKVAIGDVGYIRDGCFHLLFSAAMPLGDRVPGRHVPQSFVQIITGPTFHKQPRAPGALHNRNIQQQGASFGAASDVSFIPAGAWMSFQSSSERGAILLTKFKTYCEDVELLGSFKEYMAQYYQSWLDYANQLGHMLKLEDIIFVTGHDMTKDFAMLAFSSNSRTIGMEFEAGFPAVASASASVWGAWRTAMSAHHNYGPQHREPPMHDSRPLLEENDPLDDSPSEFNQCVFIRGFHIRRRAGLFPKVIKAAAGPHDLGSGHRFDEEGPLVSNEGTESSDMEVVAITDMPSFVNPLDPIFQYIFENSSADIAMVHDLDLINLIEAVGTSMLGNIDILVSSLTPDMIDVRPDGMACIATHDGTAVLELTAVVQNDDVHEELNSDIQRLLDGLKDANHYSRRAAITSFPAVIRDPDIRAKLSDSNIQKILSVLEDDKWFIRQLAVEAFTTVLRHDDVRARLATFGLQDKLLYAFNDEKPLVRGAAVKAFMTIAKHNEMRAKLTKSDIHKLSDCLEDEFWDVRLTAIKVFPVVVHYDNVRTELIDSLERLLNGLEDPYQDVQKATVETLTTVLQHDDIRAKLSNFVIQKLFDVLQDSRHDVRHAGIRALMAVIQHYDMRIGLTNSDLQRLLDRLEDSHEDVRQATIEAFIVVVKHDDTRAKVSHADIQKVMDFLKDKNWQIRQAAVRAFMAVIQHDDKRAGLAGSNLQMLLDGLEDPNEVGWIRRQDVQTETIKAFSAVIQYDDIRAKLSNLDTRILVRVLEDGSHDNPQAAFHYAMVFNEYNDVHTELPNSQFQRLLDDLKDDNWLIRRAAILTFTVVIQYDNLRAKLVQFSFPQTFMDALTDKEPLVRRVAWGAILEVVQHDDMREKLASHDIRKLLDVLKEVSPHVRETATNSLQRVFEHDDMRSKLSISDIQKVPEALNDKNVDVRMTAVKVFLVVVEHDDICSKLSVSDIQKLLDALNDEDPDIRENAVAAFTAILQNDDVLAKLSHYDTRKLVDATKDEESRVRQAAVKAFTEIIRHDELRAKIESSDVQRLLNTLIDEDESVRRDAIEALDAIIHHCGLLRYCNGAADLPTDDLIAKLATSDVQKLLRVLMHKYPDVWSSAKHLLREFFPDGKTTQFVSSIADLLPDEMGLDLENSEPLVD